MIQTKVLKAHDKNNNNNMNPLNEIYKKLYIMGKNIFGSPLSTFIFIFLVYIEI
jgi:hypothetical protein